MYSNFEEIASEVVHCLGWCQKMTACQWPYLSFTTCWQLWRVVPSHTIWGILRQLDMRVMRIQHPLPTVGPTQRLGMWRVWNVKSRFPYEGLKVFWYSIGWMVRWSFVNEKVNLYWKTNWFLDLILTLTFDACPHTTPHLQGWLNSKEDRPEGSMDCCFALELTQLVESLPTTVLDFSENLLLLYPLP